MCIFCDIRDDRIEGLKVSTEFESYILLDKFPVSPGHILIVSNQHGEFLADVSDSVKTKMLNLASRLTDNMKKNNTKILGFNIIINDGKHAGQHIPHLHMHLVPRYKYDRLSLLFRFLTSRLNPRNYFSKSKTKLSFYLQVQEAVVAMSQPCVTKCN